MFNSEDYIKTLDQSRDRRSLVAASLALALSEDRNAILQLGRHLRDEEFLARLDNARDPQLNGMNLQQIFDALQSHPSPLTGVLCEVLAAQPNYFEDVDRMTALLPALAAVRPMTLSAAAIFRATAETGFYSVNGPLLAENGTPEALRVYEELVRDQAVSTANRIDLLHTAVVARRDRHPIVELCVRLLSSPLVQPPEVQLGVVESLFDYRVREWYGVCRTPPRPPAWSEASTDTLELLLSIPPLVHSILPLPDHLQSAMESAVQEIEAILRERRR